MPDYEKSDKQITCWNCGTDYYDDGTEQCPQCNMCPTDEKLSIDDFLDILNVMNIKSRNRNIT